MPKRIGRFTFHSREESEKLGLIPSDAELEAARAEMAEFMARGEAMPPRTDPPGMGWGQKYYIDDLTGTEFEGWTRDPATDTWRDAHGRPAHDENGQRIRYPEDAARPVQAPGDEPRPVTPTSSAPEQPDTGKDDSGGMSFRI
ncbi:hypothetical protein [Nocardia miyunensis]|uniref:hypothetical protein n=1 Tax=Nocardia miyunensis TaxID=282684 RepID=UPI0008311736|nr:hypothetical protein [Nocardia miyunensis]